MKQRINGDMLVGIPVANSVLPLVKQKRTRVTKAASKISACGFVSVLTVLLMCLANSVVTVPAGHVGVVDLFGSVNDTPLEPGIHLINPFADIVRMSYQTQMVTMSEDVPTQEGMNVHLEAAALLHLRKDEAVRMYKSVGHDYVDRVVVPQFRSVLRSITSEHQAKDLYTGTTRLTMSKNLLSMLQKIMDTRGLVVEETPLKRLELPVTLHEAIEDKLAAEQQSQKMQFVLAKERQEADRKVIEAEGIANYQKIVSKDINENLLRWKGIEATEKLAASPNAKLVIAGNSDGLPVIFNPSSTV